MVALATATVATPVAATYSTSAMWHHSGGDTWHSNHWVQVSAIAGTDNQEKDEKQSQNDKTGLGMEKTVKDKAKSKPEMHEHSICTRSTSNDPVFSLSNPESIIRNRRRNLGDLSLSLDFEEINMANNNNNVQGPPPAGHNIPAPDLRPMEELFQAPTDGVGDAIVVPLFLLVNLRAARTWLEKEPPNSITTWNDIVSKFVNQFFPPSRTTNLRNEITRFQLRFGETFSEAWERFKDLLNKCPRHAGGNLLTRNTQEALTIIENKSKVRTSRNKPQVSSASGSTSQDAADIALTKHVEALGKHISSMNKPIHSIHDM
ncbi:reverse transcriptase domain-containing protein [Tanacetum coccineum]